MSCFKCTFFRNIFTVIMCSILGTTLSFGRDADGEIRGVDPEVRKAKDAASEIALQEIKKFAKMTEKLTTFRQTHENSYGLPSKVEELQKLKGLIAALKQNELKETQTYFDSLLKKYKTTADNFAPDRKSHV